MIGAQTYLVSKAIVGTRSNIGLKVESMEDVFDLVYEETAGIDPADLAYEVARLAPELENLSHEKVKLYNTRYAFLHLPYDSDLRDRIHRVVKAMMMLRPTMLIVIGIGGSNLGTMAIIQALYGTSYNEYMGRIKVYFADTVDPDELANLCAVVAEELESGGVVILNIVSKSGTTTETVVNSELFIALLYKYKREAYHNYIVVTTDRDSPLWKLALMSQFTCITVPAFVGGRYSVLSAAGLFPLALIGVDIDALHEGARTIEHTAKPVTTMAALLSLHAKHGMTIHNMFLFSVRLETVGKWYRQLMAESVGKMAYNSDEEQCSSMIPTVSIGSIDLHSVVQIYLAGLPTVFTTFVSVGSYQRDLSILSEQATESLVPDIRGKKISVIMESLYKGTLAAYRVNSRPYVSIVLPEKSPYYIGQFLQARMLEIVYLAYLLGVDPFDQPEVELYKKETRKILADV